MDDIFYHHGILGMKWGIRRSPVQLLRARGKPKTQTDIDNKNKKDQMRKDSKNRRNLSNEDIKKKIERLNLEKQLKDLTEENISPGKKMVADILSSSGKKVATALVTSMVTGATVYAVRSAMTKEKMTMKDAADYVVPSRKKS